MPEKDKTKKAKISLGIKILSFWKKNWRALRLKKAKILKKVKPLKVNQSKKHLTQSTTKKQWLAPHILA